ncbi:helix-turn-helix domain-containing protein [Nocardioides dongxiaopingii]|uniref:tetratricopeptide repeat protein n=1 Tax=Nocardioides TaxID=1839 RepID=UPI0010C77125|nr:MULTISPECIES: tetratricopeptide repeat protein [Nocardioides]QCW52492.2 helix-turn-helix domain-containing protein [Nocardioides sp. S-1144]
MHLSERVTPDLRVRAKNIDAALVGSRIKYARQRAGLTQGEAAGDHMSTAYISRIEGGQRRASAELLVLLADRLGCDPDELLAPDEDAAAAELLARLTLEVDYVELDLRTGQSGSALSRVDRLLAEDDVPDEVAVRARYQRALALEACGRLADAILGLEDVVAASTEGLPLIQALIALSRCYREEGDLARACEVGERAEQLVDATELRGSAEGIQLAVTVAAAHFERGDINYALRLCERAVESAELLESPTARASAYWNSSIVHQRQGNISAALPLAQKAVALLDQTHDARNMARLRLQLGLLQLKMDPPEVDGAFLNLTQSSDEMAFTDASVVDRGRVQLGLAKARLLVGDAEEAERLAEDCFEKTRDTSLMLASEARLVLGQIAIHRGHVEQAVEFFRHAIVILDGVGAGRESAQMWFELGTLLQQHGAMDDALDAFRRAGASTGLTRPTTVSSRTAVGTG